MYGLLSLGSKSNGFFLMMTSEEALYSVPPIAITDLLARLQVPVTKGTANILRHVPREYFSERSHLTSN